MNLQLLKALPKRILSYYPYHYQFSLNFKFQIRRYHYYYYRMSHFNQSNLEPELPLPKLDKKELVPKEETQVSNFLKKYPNYDGRGTVVAILDTGVDPGAAGLKVTSDGKPKLIDIIDCTGSGDVRIDDEPVQLDKEDNSIIGKSGRKIYLNPKWKNPSGKYYLGLKKLKELYPDSIIKRVDQSNYEKQKQDNDQLIKNIQEQLLKLNNNNSNSKQEEEKELELLKNKRKDLEAQNQALSNLIEQFKNDYNPILDVIVFNDGNDYLVAVDFNMDGNLKDSIALKDYFIEREYWPLNYFKPPYELLNISVKVYEDGKLISLVSSAGTHATHVAGILASHHPEDPNLDGVAPGAQLVSLKIGETRLGSMETQIGLTRAIAAMVQHKCDLANMSYGEASKLPNEGRFIQWLSKEVIRRYNCIFISSAGNEGPALSTVGSPGGTSEDVIGVGAYVNHSMMKTDYSQLEYGPDMAYSWSSRGPTTDGAMGVDIYAPGGAITSVPTYILYKTQLMNGTSMSSPNLCGCVALLVSALKQENMRVTSYRISHAIKNSSKAFKVRNNEDKASSAGIIQVENAFNYLKTYESHDDLDTIPEIKILNHDNKRGIYLREKYETENIFFANVSIQPKFLNDQSVIFGNEINFKKYEMELYLSLIATQPFIKVPEVIAYNNGGRNFTFKIDPTNLEEGAVYYGEVLGYDSRDFNKGPILRIPITIIKPLSLNQSTYELKDFSVSPGSILRRFINVPENATSCTLKITSKSNSNYPVKMYAHLIQLKKQERFTTYENKYLLSFNINSNSKLNGTGNQIEERTFSVLGNQTLELCLAQFWSNYGNQQFDIELNFNGIKIEQLNNKLHSPLLLDGSIIEHKLDLLSNLKRESKVNIKANLNLLQKTLLPNKVTIQPLLSKRDLLPPNNQLTLYQLLLEYNFNINNNNTKIQLNYPYPLQQYLYDSFFDGFFIMILNSFNQPISYDEVSPRIHELKKKGEYKVIMELNHTDLNLLEKIKKENLTYLNLQINLNKEINCSIYQHPHGFYNNNQLLNNNLIIEKNENLPIYLKVPNLIDEFEIKSGELLLGKIHFNNNLPKNQQINFGIVLSPKINLNENNNEIKIPLTEEIFENEHDLLNFELLKTKLKQLINLKDNNLKLNLLNEILEKEMDQIIIQHDKNKELILLRNQLEILNSGYEICFNLNNLTNLSNLKLNEFNLNLILKLNELTKKVINNHYEVRNYFNLKEQDIQIKNWMNLKKEILNKNLIGEFLFKLNEIENENKNENEKKILLKELKQLLNLNQTYLNNNNNNFNFNYLLLLFEIQLLKFENYYGITLLKVMEFINELEFNKNNESKLIYLIDLQLELIQKLNFDKVWLNYLKNWKLNTFWDKKYLIYG